MKTVKANVDFVQKAPRLELLIRIFWLIIAGIVLYFFSIIAVIIMVVQWFHILFLGRRNASMQSWIKTVVVQRYLLSAYGSLLTDERPPIIPEMQKE